MRKNLAKVSTVTKPENKPSIKQMAVNFRFDCMFLYFCSPVILLVESQTRRAANKTGKLGSCYTNITVTVLVKWRLNLFCPSKSPPRWPQSSLREHFYVRCDVKFPIKTMRIFTSHVTQTCSHNVHLSLPNVTI